MRIGGLVLVSLCLLSGLIGCSGGEKKVDMMTQGSVAAEGMDGAKTARGKTDPAKGQFMGR
ncbi:MAG: hypothetical protein JST35_05580 [Armatimonadetes bacterium]|nr:hypothetical protein [Armatimonadota bacterium]